MNPLPSLLQASAWDAANESMRAGGRTAWNEDDFSAACVEKEELIAVCYSRPGDTDERTKYVRFGIATSLQQQGYFNLASNYNEVLDWIDAYIENPTFEQVAQ